MRLEATGARIDPGRAGCVGVGLKADEAGVLVVSGDGRWDDCVRGRRGAAGVVRRCHGKIFDGMGRGR